MLQWNIEADRITTNNTSETQAKLSVAFSLFAPLSFHVLRPSFRGPKILIKAVNLAVSKSWRLSTKLFDRDVSSCVQAGNSIYLRELDLEEDGDRQFDQDVDERDEDGIDRGEDAEVDSEAKLDNPLAACSCDFLRSSLTVSIQRLHNDSQLDIDGAGELGDDVDAHLDVGDDLGNDGLAVAVLSVIAFVCTTELRLDEPKSKVRNRPLTEEVNIDIELDIEVEQRGHWSLTSVRATSMLLGLLVPATQGRGSRSGAAHVSMLKRA
ncbi:hypothetical protein RHS01_09256 [Rhizoctonia solani]|uniref:Uncharacterized protein n=1 Tax=Rhizoctonia solani TaxID=456999 RepID=A0A8H7LY69_9AGAM|nr:hypothetical protein RHS01_09256 [Rhizoctonia solani]